VNDFYANLYHIEVTVKDDHTDADHYSLEGLE